MTPEEFAEEMHKRATAETQYKFSDIEENHFAMDALMCQVLSDLGYNKGVAIFEHTKKWYA